MHSQIRALQVGAWACSFATFSIAFWALVGFPVRGEHIIMFFSPDVMMLHDCVQGSTPSRDANVWSPCGIVSDFIAHWTALCF